MNIFAQFIKSFYSPKELAPFRFQGIGKTILYIFVMMLILSLPVGTKLTLSILNGSEKLLEMLSTNIPNFELKNGRLEVEQSEAFLYKDDKLVVIIDTTGEISNEEWEQYDFGFIFLEKQAIVIENGIQQSYRYSELGDVHLAKSQIIDLITSIRTLLPIFIPILLLFLYLFVTAMKFIGITFLGAIGIIIKNKKQVRLNYKQLWTLSAYAVTLPTAIFNILDTANIVIPFSFVLYWLIAIAMLYSIINHVPKPKIIEEPANNDIQTQ